MNLPNKYDYEINREALLLQARTHLLDLKRYEKRVLSMTLYIREEYGYSTLRVYLDKDQRAELAKDQDPDVDLSFLNGKNTEQPNMEFIQNE